MDTLDSVIHAALRANLVVLMNIPDLDYFLVKGCGMHYHFSTLFHLYLMSWVMSMSLARMHLDKEPPLVDVLGLVCD